MWEVKCLLGLGAEPEALGKWAHAELLSTTLSVVAAAVEDASKVSHATGFLTALEKASREADFLCADLAEPASTLRGLLTAPAVSLDRLELALGHAAQELSQPAPAPGSLAAWLRTAAGRRLVKPGEAAMSARQGEAEGQALVTLAEGCVAALRAQTVWAPGTVPLLQELELHVRSGVVASSQGSPRPASPVTCTATQRDALATARAAGWAWAAHLLQRRLQEKWVGAVTAALDAYAQGGLVHFRGEGGEDFRGPLDLATLRDLLKVDAQAHPELCGPGAAVAYNTEGASLASLLQQHEDDCILFLGVVDFVFSVTVPRPLAAEPAPLELTAMLAFPPGLLPRWSVTTEHTELFQEKFLTVVRQGHILAVQREAETAYVQVRALVAQCGRGE
jgi:hypothetical protein